MATYRPGFVHPCFKITFDYHSAIYFWFMQAVYFVQFPLNPIIFLVSATFLSYSIVDMATQMLGRMQMTTALCRVLQLSVTTLFGPDAFLQNVMYSA
jgi:hypothetical protein